MRVHNQATYGLAAMVAVALSAAAPRATLHAQPAAADDAEWLSQCQHHDWERSDRAHVCEIRVQRLPRPTTLTVDGGENGGVTITGWDGDSVVMHALVRAAGDSPEEAHDMASRVTISSSNGRIRADGPASGRHEWWSVSYRIFVPRHSDLAIETLNGPMSVEMVTGRMTMRTVNGPLSLSQVGGEVHARAENGPLDIGGGGPPVRLITTNGPVTLKHESE